MRRSSKITIGIFLGIVIAVLTFQYLIIPSVLYPRYESRGDCVFYMPGVPPLHRNVFQRILEFSPQEWFRELVCIKKELINLP